MTFRYLPDTDQDEQEMLQTLDKYSIDELFADIPEAIRLKRPLQIAEGLSEPDLLKKMKHLASKNNHASDYACFLGAGTYDHYIPSVVGHMISRSEFYTSYTPYQPEISQGGLQAIFEFQSMVCELTGMDAANSSMYDGHTALAEAASLAVSKTKRSKVLVSEAVHPESIQIMSTVARGLGYDIEIIACHNDVTNTEQLAQIIDDQTAAVILQYPNFFGSIEDLAEIKNISNDHKAMFVVSANPLALALLEAPGHLGADIVVGDVQPLGIPMSFGGPHCGYFAVKKKLMRNIPGRVVGQTTDTNGKRGFVLTLQAREQHIRREKASSNICSNQALNALAASVCMTALGKQGIQKMAHLNLSKANYMQQTLVNKGYRVLNQAPIFNEFVVCLNRPVKLVNQELLDAGMIGGLDVSDSIHSEQAMLIAVTEKRTKAEIDAFIAFLEGGK